MVGKVNLVFEQNYNNHNNLHLSQCLFAYGNYVRFMYHTYVYILWFANKNTADEYLVFTDCFSNLLPLSQENLSHVYMQTADYRLRAPVINHPCNFIALLLITFILLKCLGARNYSSTLNRYPVICILTECRNLKIRKFILAKVMNRMKLT